MLQFNHHPSQHNFHIGSQVGCTPIDAKEREYGYVVGVFLENKDVYYLVAVSYNRTVKCKAIDVFEDRD